MANMTYCRFRNTVEDLEDCYEAMEEDVSSEEERARKRLIKLACEIALNYGHEVGIEVERV
jgi:hypothetical protein